MKTLEGVVSRNAPGVEIKHDNAAHEDAKHHNFSNGGLDRDSFYNDSNRDHMMATTHNALPMMVEDELEAEPGEPVPPGEPAIPINHTTLAGLLLDWPGIRELVKRHLEREGIRHIREFPISLEQKRGPLKVHGCGEGSHHLSSSREMDNGALDLADDSSDISSPSPAADWGQLGGRSPADTADVYKGGVLGADGYPDFSEGKVWQYVESFKENILNMHPIIQPDMLNLWVKHFLESLPTAGPKAGSKQQSAKGMFATGGPGSSSSSGQPQNDTPGSKRKRSPSPEPGRGPPTPSATRIGRPDRSIHSALILTVLALGKICLRREYIPDVAHATDPIPQGSPVGRNGVLPSPNQSSPPGHNSQSHSSAGQPSPMETERGSHSRRPSVHGAPSVSTWLCSSEKELRVHPWSGIFRPRY